MQLAVDAKVHHVRGWEKFLDKILGAAQKHLPDSEIVRPYGQCTASLLGGENLLWGNELDLVWE